MSSPSNSYSIRLARIDEISQLSGIEDEAGSMFSGLGLVDETLDQPFPLDRLLSLISSSQVWVCCREDNVPVGMVIASVWGNTVYIEEIDVLPAYGRRGLGTRLLKHVCSWASSQGAKALLLSTFRDVPWNRPFYKKNGFRELSPIHWTKRLRLIREKERQNGLSTDARVFMILELSTSKYDLLNTPRRLMEQLERE